MGLFWISGFFSLFGMIGALKEHYCSTVTFTVYILLSTIDSFINASQAPILFLWAFLNVGVSTLALSFSRRLRKERISRASQPQNQIALERMLTDSNRNQQTDYSIVTAFDN